MSGCNETKLKKLDEAMMEDGKSSQTKEKYRRDIQMYLDFACSQCKKRGGKEEYCFSREGMARYRSLLFDRCRTASANSRIAAMNYFFRACGRADLRIRHFRVQQSLFRPAEKDLTKEEYHRLLEAARKEENQRLYMIMQTIAATGLRVSELPFVTVESIRIRRVTVTLKGKTRIVLMPGKLCRRLQEYAEQKKIRSGSLFVTRTGRPVDRSNIAHEMKQLCALSGIRKEKVFPHNLRHLFAVTYYRKERDLLHLADLMGHSNVNTTRIYTSMGVEEYEQQIESLELLD